MNRPAIFLDRDGTLTVDSGYTYRTEDIELIAGVAEGLRGLQDLGYALIVVTNQSGIARGLFSEEQMHRFHAALRKRLNEEDVSLTEVYFCPFHPAAQVPQYRQDSPLRKPRPGMLLKAAEEHGIELADSFAIGDKKSDVVAGKAAGCRTVLLQTGQAGQNEPDISVLPDHIAADLSAAAQWIKSLKHNGNGISPNHDCAYPSPH